MNQINPIKVPRHLAVIMDGTGRWSKLHKYSGIAGYEQGAENAKNLAKLAIKYEIKVLTLFLFSIENWQRPENAVQGLMQLLNHYLSNNLAEFDEQNIQLRVIGELDRLPAETQNNIQQAVNATAKNTGLKLQLAISYGGQDEIVSACNQILAVYHLKQEPVQITRQEFAKYLYTKDLPEVEFLIRTGGEQRLSNFLLWQLSYAELYFCEKLWPDFSENDLIAALQEFAKRTRNFGSARNQ